MPPFMLPLSRDALAAKMNFFKTLFLFGRYSDTSVATRFAAAIEIINLLFLELTVRDMDQLSPSCWKSCGLN